MEAEIKLGWQVDYWPVGHLVEVMDSCTEEEVQAKYDEYLERYELATDNLEAIRYQAREEVAMRKILTGGAKAFINNFQDLYGMRQLPRHRLPEHDGRRLRLRRRGRLEGGRHDRHHEGHGRGHGGPGRGLYGGLHL